MHSLAQRKCVQNDVATRARAQADWVQRRAQLFEANALELARLADEAEDALLPEVQAELEKAQMQVEAELRRLEERDEAVRAARERQRAVRDAVAGVLETVARVAALAAYETAGAVRADLLDAREAAYRALLIAQLVLRLLNLSGTFPRPPPPTTKKRERLAKKRKLD